MVFDFGLVAGPWAYALHGSEASSYLLSQMDPITVTIGAFGMTIAFVYLAMFFAFYNKVVLVERKMERKEILEKNLSEDVKTHWEQTKYLTYTCMILGFIILMWTNIVNEGFIKQQYYRASSGQWSFLILCVITCALNLWLLIGVNIVDIESTGNEDGKSQEELEEDEKYHKFFAPDKIYGSVMSTLYLIVLVTIGASGMTNTGMMQNTFGIAPQAMYGANLPQKPAGLVR